MKNLKSLLTNGALILLSVLTFIFMSQAYITGTMGSVSVSTNGYDVMDASDGGSKYQLLAASNIIVCVVISVIILVAILSLLVDFGVIKNKKLGKILNLTNVVMTLLMVIFSICAISAMGSIVGDLNALVDAYSIGWALILNLVLSVIALVVAGFAMLTARKK